LLARALEAHGGLDRWNAFETVSATVVTGGSSGQRRASPWTRSPGVRPRRRANSEMRRLAEEAIAAQEHEIAQLRGFLAGHAAR